MKAGEITPMKAERKRTIRKGETKLVHRAATCVVFATSNALNGITCACTQALN